MFKKLFNFIPFIKRLKENRLKNNKKRLINDLYRLMDSYKNAINYDDVFKEFINILNNPLIKRSNKLITNKSTKVSFHTKTSLNALDLIYNGVYDIPSLKASTSSFSFYPKERAYIYWESNDDSILLFYNFMEDMINKAYQLRTIINHNEINHKLITEEEELFINSSLFRYLCLDIISLLIILMEESNESI